jgi:hypothetical protein
MESKIERLSLRQNWLTKNALLPTLSACRQSTREMAKRKTSSSSASAAHCVFAYVKHACLGFRARIHQFHTPETPFSARKKVKGFATKINHGDATYQDIVANSAGRLYSAALGASSAAAVGCSAFSSDAAGASAAPVPAAGASLSDEVQRVYKGPVSNSTTRSYEEVDAYQVVTQQLHDQC